ncbi:MAG: response regulator [Gemmataceae bacterium]|nr:response regulator [Gemmataceae bacterium]
MSDADILLVEDNISDIKLAMRALERHDLAARVRVVRDGAEALDYLFGTGPFEGKPPPPRPRVVLLDLKLPRVDGHEVLRRVKGSPDTHDIPVVVFTSSGEGQDVAASYRLGANGYVQKPIEFEPLMEAVGRLGLFWVLANKVPYAAD